MTVLLSPSAKQQFFTNAGAPAAGYKLYTYAANTTTPQATYTNRAGTSANTNPIILDARGEATIYLTPGVVYDFTLKTDTDALVWTREDVTAQAGDASAITFTQAGTGAVERLVSERLEERVSVKDFGATGDGTTDDTAAIQAAFDAADGRIVYAPAGTYICAGDLDPPAGSFALAGDGAGHTEIRFTSATASEQGIAVALTASGSDYFLLCGLTLSTSTGYAAGKNAFTVDGTAQVSGSQIANRSFRRGVIDDVVVRGLGTTSTGWDIGIRLTSVTNFHINNYTFWGEDDEGSATGLWQGTGIRIDGAGTPVESKMTNLWVHSAYYGVFAPDYSEGLYLTNFDFVNVRYGFYSRYVAGESVLAEASCGCLQPTIGPGHIKCFYGGVAVSRVNQALLRGLNIYVAAQAGVSNYYGISLTTGANNYISDCSITDLATGTDPSWGILFNDIDRSFINNVGTYAFTSSGFNLTNDSDDNIISNCLAHDTGNIAIGDSTSGNNWLSKNKAVSITGAKYGGSLASTSFLDNPHYAVSAVPSLAGGAAFEDVNISIPAGFFPAKPTVIIANAEANSQNIVCTPFRESASTTATNMVIRLFKNDGTNLAAGAVRIYVVAYE